MSFAEKLIQFAATVQQRKSACSTEEATKHSLILPVIQMLGYDIFDPTEVVPEVDCDLKKSGDKVDYIIQRNGHHSLIVECKHWNKNLDNYVSQLGAYYAASEARFGILTNGIVYRFYADLEKSHLMDDKPFWVVDMGNLDETAAERLGMFRKDVFDVDRILQVANSNRLTKRLNEVVAQELAEPSRELLLHFAKLVYGYSPSQKMRDQFRPLLQSAINEYLNNRKVDIQQQPSITATEQGSECDTTEDELEAYSIVRDILKDTVATERVTYADFKTYFTIRLDDNEWFPIVKTKLTANTKWIVVSKYTSNYKFYGDLSKKNWIDNLEDIRIYAKDIRDVVKVMLTDGDSQRMDWVTKNRPDWIEH